MQKFMKGATWMDAPVESAHLFHKRFKEYMRAYIKRENEGAGLLGRVLQYVVRFEVQGRGSCECGMVSELIGCWVWWQYVVRVMTTLLCTLCVC
jgi:hypothetical protein